MTCKPRLKLSLLGVRTCTQESKQEKTTLPISVYTTVSSAPALAMTSPLQNEAHLFTALTQRSRGISSVAAVYTEGSSYSSRPQLQRQGYPRNSIVIHNSGMTEIASRLYMWHILYVTYTLCVIIFPKIKGRGKSSCENLVQYTSEENKTTLPGTTIYGKDQHLLLSDPTGFS